MSGSRKKKKNPRAPDVKGGKGGRKDKGGEERDTHKRATKK
jgi:hypothetical protein